MGLFESQIETRRRLDSEMVDRSYAELAASVSGPSNTPGFRPGDLEMADGAVRTCLRHCGVEAGPVPEGLTDPEERLAWLCAPSGTMRRDVHLEGAGYQNAVGVMLGHLDTGEPVALLPGALGGYYYHDPSTGRRCAVNSGSAAHIRQEWEFLSTVRYGEPFPGPQHESSDS